MHRAAGDAPGVARGPSPCLRARAPRHVRSIAGHLTLALSLDLHLLLLPLPLLLALPASYVAGMQVLVRSIVSDREPAILSGSFTAQSFAAAAHMMVSTDRGARVPTFTSLVPAQLAKLHHDAHDQCYIANSVKTEVVVVAG